MFSDKQGDIAQILSQGETMNAPVPSDGDDTAPNQPVSKKALVIGIGIVAFVLILALIVAAIYSTPSSKKKKELYADVPETVIPQVPDVAASATTLAPVADQAKSDVVTVGGYTEQQLAARGFVLVKGPFVLANTPYGKEGVTYMDLAGNTYERHTLGWRECLIHSNRGRLVAAYFIGDLSQAHDIVQTVTECKLIAAQEALKMRATTPFTASVREVKKG